MASLRSLSQNTAAIRVGGSPFKTLAQAEEACKANAGISDEKSRWGMTLGTPQVGT
jgi:hypothetical protein